MANRFRRPKIIYVQKYIHIEIEKVDVFRKVLNKQFIDRLRAIFITNKHNYKPLQTVSLLGGIIRGT